jgi:hypothetical protein
MPTVCHGHRIFGTILDPFPEVQGDEAYKKFSAAGKSGTERAEDEALALEAAHPDCCRTPSRHSSISHAMVATTRCSSRTSSRAAAMSAICDSILQCVMLVSDRVFSVYGHSDFRASPALCTIFSPGSHIVIGISAGSPQVTNIRIWTKSMGSWPLGPF